MIKILNKQNNKNKAITKIDNFSIYNKPYTFFKQDYNSIIPRVIYQTWVTKDLPQKMKERVELLFRRTKIYV